MRRSHEREKEPAAGHFLVTAQTAYNLDRLAAMCGYREPGHVVDKLVREKMLELNGGKRHERNEN